MNNLESTRNGWILIVLGLVLLASTVVTVAIIPEPLNYISGGIILIHSASTITIGILEHRSALNHRREMRALNNR